MRIHDYQVLQRNNDDKSLVTLSNGDVIVLPVGGPYEVDGAKEVYVGDLWVLAGQSNMQGIGDMIDVETPSPFVHSLTSAEVWNIASEPLHRVDQSPRLVHHVLDGRPGVPEPIPALDPNPIKGAGLGLSFAKAMYEKTGVPIGLIPAAHGGTSMAQWDPKLKVDGDASLYGATLARINDTGGKVAGILWYQGESDTGEPHLPPMYIESMRALVESFRSDLNKPDLPFYYVQIGNYVMADNPTECCGWSAIREAQRQFEPILPNLGMATAIDLGLDDNIHVGTQDLKRLGQRLANIALGKLSPRLKGITFDASHSEIRIEYDNVQGSLQSPGLPTGFMVRLPSGAEFRCFYKTILDGSAVILKLITNELPAGAALWYGWGMMPYCNITDSADAAIPGFGPILLES
jgi:hypothetical protein